MSRVFGLILVGCALVGLTGCVGPMSAGCGPLGGCNGPVGATCDAGCSTAGCSTGGCDSCSGCGELYVDPWINHPPDCVDPCDTCGNYNGQSCGKCRSAFSGIKTFWGYRCGCPAGPIATTDRQFAPGCSAGCDGGCDGCLVEPACGCEGNVCDCGVGLEPGCGFEPGCGLEPGCGFEPACGCEGPCGCSGGAVHSYAPTTSEIMPIVPGGSATEIITPPVAEAPYHPSRTRKIFNPKTETARGFLNEYRR